MESTQNLKKRIKSIGNIKKITKAMELVAATKMRKAQEVALASRPYAFVALDLLASVSLLKKTKKQPLPALLQKRNIKNSLVVLMASDKGLAGSFNSSVFRKFERYFSKEKKYSDIPHNVRMNDLFFVAIGEKSYQYLQKKFKSPSTVDQSTVLQKFTSVGDFTTPLQVQPLVDFIIKGYVEKKWDNVLVFSTHFRSALKQEPLMRELLPITFESLKETIREIVPETGRFSEMKSSFAQTGKSQEYVIEPSPERVLEDLAKHLVFMQIYDIILEANASEHSARRLAMKTACDNASDLGDRLNLQYNKARQGKITKQIIEIVSGAESLS